MPAPDEAAIAELVALHAEIDQAVARLADRHRGRLQCRRGCSACCLDDLTVSRIEAERIRVHHRALLESRAPGPEGACAFLDEEGACRIYADRPSVCRSQGLPLRVLFEDDAGEIAERRDICPLNLEGGPPLETLAESDCWLIGPFELRLASLEARFAGENAPREALRDLFEASGPSDATRSGA